MPEFDRPLHLSVIIPFFNEAQSLDTLLDELEGVLSNQSYSYEVLLIDDGSADATGALIERRGLAWPECRIFRFATNQGQAAALYFGIQQSRGSIILVMDGDGQNDPRDIPALLKRMQDSGADMVMGVRTKRNDSLLRRGMSRLANRVRWWILRDGVRDAGCGLKMFKSEVGQAFIPLRTLYSFMPALAVGAGFTVVEQSVNHRPRITGVSKYGLGVMFWRPTLDMLGVWWFTQRRCSNSVRLLKSTEDVAKHQVQPR